MQTATDLPAHIRLGVMRLARRLRKEVHGQVTPSELSALAVLDRHGPLTLGELADLERVAPPTVTRVAARLEEAGLVVRRVDPADRRVARMTVSAQGRRLLKEIRDRRDAYLAARLQSFTAEERATLSEALPLLDRLTGDVP